ncbi:hypothetical protein AMAG_10304 [Allomyces macrogynus ATCC 38327]|uniref:SHSP domain-containing protein n=1 Tax=Allomyces macrogynus (strain ATCC 38327) TaxID=578462 RepID=A0A0L0SU07_ALLM3|nr:hypothetical protein AMAG_10304 [Allomyces macrogynus ATCC 38327]|eukprot:KNE66028.1 hypothetical protein AMAG_10304 [Allomyces macrogynus ATCC 38327]
MTICCSTRRSSLLTLVYLAGALACALAYLPRLDKAVHVYLVWPLNYFVLEALVLLGPTHTHALVPLAASVIYHLVLRRTLVSMRLWQHSRSFPHLHVAVPRHRHAESPIAERDMPDIQIDTNDIDEIQIHGEAKRFDEFQAASSRVRERNIGRFRKVIRLPPGCLLTNITARYKDGLLEVRVPKGDNYRRIDVS